jgi:hypothetical protein
MTDPPLQVWTLYIAIDIHKHYLIIGGIDGHKRIVLQHGWPLPASQSSRAMG